MHQPECSRNVCTIIKTYQELDCIIQFLKGLNKSYAVVKSQIVIMEPILDIRRVFYIVSKHERQLKNKNISPLSIVAEPHAFYVRTEPRHPFQFTKKPLYSFYGGTN